MRRVLGWRRQFEVCFALRIDDSNDAIMPGEGYCLTVCVAADRIKKVIAAANAVSRTCLVASIDGFVTAHRNELIVCSIVL